MAADAGRGLGSIGVAGTGGNRVTYEEISRELTVLASDAGEHVRLVRGADLDATAVHLLPVAWFIAMKMLGRLYMGTYQGRELRIVGTKDVAFDEVTPEFLREEFNNALAEQVGCLLDPDSVMEFFSRLKPGNQWGRGNLGPQ
jgi:hypothetical protein